MGFALSCHSGTQPVAIQPAEEKTGWVCGGGFWGLGLEMAHTHTPIPVSGVQSHGVTNLQEGLENVG